MLLIGALVGALWFGAFVVLHVAVSTKRPVTARSRLLLRLFTPACAGTLLSAAVVPLDIIPGIAPTSHRAVALLAALVVIASGFVLYAPLYYTIVSSISVQTLIAIDAASNKRVRRLDSRERALGGGGCLTSNVTVARNRMASGGWEGERPHEFSREARVVEPGRSALR
jgi:hypothetical protein